MSTVPALLPGIYAFWNAFDWSILLKTAPPAAPASEPIARVAQAAALHEWEDEGGSVAHVQTPRAKPAARRRARAAKKRSRGAS